MADKGLSCGDLVEFKKGGIAFGLKGQVKKVYDDGSVRAVLIPVERPEDPHSVVWRRDDIVKI